MSSKSILGSVVLLGAIAAIVLGLAAWKRGKLAESASHGAMTMPPDAVLTKVASEREYQRTTISIGTVMALRSVTLQNELAGTVRRVDLAPGRIVEGGTVLVALDTSVEEAELAALEAQAELAATMLGRMERARETKGASDTEVDRARSERDVLLANVARTKAVIAKQKITAPFRAKIGLSDVHVGQYLSQGTTITTLQGVDEAANVDFTVTQDVAAMLKPGHHVAVSGNSSTTVVDAVVVAIDARVDSATRNAVVRARIEGPASQILPPGSAVRVRVPVGAPRKTVVVPASALRRGPGGDHVFVVEPGANGALVAHQRPVQSGPLLGDEVVLESGVTAGERVATSGSFKLREGSLVVDAGEAPGAAPH